MVQVLPSNTRRSIGQALAGGVSEGMGPALQQYMQQQQQAQKEAQAMQMQQQQMQQENQAFPGLAGLSDPKMRQIALSEQLKGKSSMEKEFLKQQLKQEGQRQLFDEIGLESFETAGTQPKQTQEMPEGEDTIRSEQEGPQLIPDKTIAKIAAVNPAIARDLRERNKSILKERTRQEDLVLEKEKQARGEQLSFHKESQAYDDQLLKNTKTAKNQLDSLKNVKKAINSGNVTPGKLANLFKNNMGGWGDKLSNALLNQDQATILASIPGLLEGWKEVFGVRLSDADLRLLQDKLPDIGKSPESNNAIVKIMEKYADQSLLRAKIAKDIKSQNGGLRPLGYGEKVEERFDQMVAPVRIVNPKTGNIIEIPAYKLSDAISSGARLADE